MALRRKRILGRRPRNAVNRLTARNKLAVAGDVVAHFAVEHARCLFQHVPQGIKPGRPFVFSVNRQRLRRFALGQADARGGGSWNGVVGGCLFADAFFGRRQSPVNPIPAPKVRRQKCRSNGNRQTRRTKFR